jgi:hypothetical protein
VYSLILGICLLTIRNPNQLTSVASGGAITKGIVVQYGISCFIFVALCVVSQNSIAQSDYRISAVYSPYFEAKADIDSDELNGGIKFNHNLDSGHGAGLKLSVVNNDYRGASVLSVAYYQGKQKEIENEMNVRSHSLYLEAGPEYNFAALNNIRPFGAFIVGAGLVKFDFQSNKSQEWAGAAEAGFQIGVKLSRKLKVSVGGTYFLWGYPTETIGHGVFLSSEVGIEF